MKAILTLLTVLFSILKINAQDVTLGVAPLAEDGRMYYEIRGEGLPLILLHGHTLDRRMWEPQLKEFSKHFKVITIDFRGYGLSSKQSESLHTTHVDDLLTLMNHLHIQKAHIVGLSMGGFVAGDMLGMYPERMLSCVMCSGALRSKHKSINEPTDTVEIEEEREKIALIQQQGVEKWRHDWIEQLITHGGSRQESIRQPLTEMIMDWDCFQITHVEPRLYYGREAMQNLVEKQPSVPTMYLSGETEHKKPMGMLRYLPISEQVELKDCGHMSNMEQPEMFNKTILEFLKKHSH